MITVELTCVTCHNQFTQSVNVLQALAPAFQGKNPYALPKHCPKCKDEYQGRPNVVLNRKTLYSSIVKIDKSILFLMKNAVEFKPEEHDVASWRHTVKGRDYGTVGQGRIDIYSHIWPLVADQYALLAYNEVEREVWGHYIDRVVGPMNDRREVQVWRRTEPNAEGATKRTETNNYVVLTPTEIPESETRLQIPVLAWVVAKSKTTLKGFGRQYTERIEGNSIWKLEVSGEYRSGRAWVNAVLATMDEDDPLTIVGGLEQAGEVRSSIVE